MRDGAVNPVTETDAEALDRQKLLGQLVVDDGEDVFFDEDSPYEEISAKPHENESMASNEYDLEYSNTKKFEIDKLEDIKPDAVNETKVCVHMKSEVKKQESLPIGSDLAGTSFDAKSDAAHSNAVKTDAKTSIINEIPVAGDITPEKSISDDNVESIRAEINEKYRKGNLQIEDISKYMSAVSESIFEAGMERRLISIKEKYFDCEQTGEIVKYFIDLKRLYRDARYKLEEGEI